MDTSYGPRLFISRNTGDLLSAETQDNRMITGGILTADEPEEDCSFSELMSQARKKIACLVKKGAKFIVAENCQTLQQARIAVFAARKEKLPLIVTMLCDAEGIIPSGGTVTAALISLQSLGVSAFGISGNLTPQESADVLELAVPFAKIPLAASPTAGNPNPILPDVYDLSPQNMADAITPILDCGVSVLLENKGVSPEHAGCIRQKLFSFDSTALHLEREDELEHIILANEKNFFIISNERLDFTEPIPCHHDMSDDFIAAEEDSVDVLEIQIDTPDDSVVFAENAHLAGLPVMFRSDDELALKSALMLYNGKAMIDTDCAIEKENLEKIAKKYGSILY